MKTDRKVNKYLLILNSDTFLSDLKCKMLFSVSYDSYFDVILSARIFTQYWITISQSSDQIAESGETRIQSWIKKFSLTLPTKNWLTCFCSFKIYMFWFSFCVRDVQGYWESSLFSISYDFMYRCVVCVYLWTWFIYF